VTNWKSHEFDMLLEVGTLHLLISTTHLIVMSAYNDCGEYLLLLLLGFQACQFLLKPVIFQ